jgi:hypothetical protein
MNVEMIANKNVVLVLAGKELSIYNEKRTTST